MYSFVSKNDEPSKDAVAGVNSGAMPLKDRVARVLILESQLERGESFIQVLEDEGHLVSMVHDAYTACMMIAAERFDAWLIEGAFLETSGGEFLSTLSDEANLPLVYVVGGQQQLALTRECLPKADVRAFHGPGIVERLLRDFRITWHGAPTGVHVPEGVNELLDAMEAKDHYTAGHGERVGELARMIAETMGLSDDEVELIYVAGRLHDIGKLALDDSELMKPGPLSVEEFERLKQHPLEGEALLAPYPSLDVILPAVSAHHERLDGKGYPRGLSAEHIPMMARIVTVADAYDAMTTDRAYRMASSHEDAMAELKRCSGAQFDGAVVAAFERALDALEDLAS